MGSVLGDLPSFDPHNFSQLRPSDPSNPSKMIPATHHPTHSRTLPPPDQVITTEAKNILIRNFYQRAEEKVSNSFMIFHVTKLHTNNFIVTDRNSRIRACPLRVDVQIFHVVS
ncbi:uncharacterized protein LOC111278371 isoform X1 [Durio zibethinus]|uniref:Uncharacterized protein LOC111278371 isoform X1 n=1 Tax=Durio zibethinus TaxID=66656 RepID=A0A6P5WY06_DURZI|nr:uncharacterized protein LOC111278371 isoform X1 [Durio zibethinus]